MEFGKYSPMYVACEDKLITIRDMPTLSNHEKKLLKTFFSKYHTKKFSSSQRKKLQELDRYLDIPLVQAVFDKYSTFTSFCRLLDNDCEIIPKKFKTNTNIVYMSIKRNHLPAYIKALELGCKLFQHQHDFLAIPRIPHHYSVTWLAMIHGSIDILNYAYQEGPICECCNDQGICYRMNEQCINGKLGRVPVNESKVIQCLQFLKTKGHTGNTILCAYAAAAGWLECLQYLISEGCAVDGYITSLYAAANGHLHVLTYLMEHNYNWNALLTFYAARHGHLDCLRYIHQKGCFISEVDCLAAISHGHVHCVQYMIEHGCHAFQQYLSHAQRFGQHNCITFLTPYVS